METSASRILFFSRDRGSVQSTLPVAVALSRQPGVEVVVLSIPGASARLLEASGLPHQVVDSEAYARDPERYLEAQLGATRPALVVSGSSPARGNPPETPEQFLIQAARRRGVPSVAVLDFWGMYRERFCDNSGKLDHTLLPDRLCVLDHICRSDLHALGVPLERMTVTHNPWFDAIVAEARNARTASPEKPPWAERTYLFVSQPLAENASARGWTYTQDTLFHTLLAALPTDEAAQIIVWPHPAESQKRWSQERLPRRPGTTIEVTAERGGAIFADVDLLVSSHSTVAYEALYHDVPCVSLRLRRPWPNNHIVDRLGLSRQIHSVDELRELIRSTTPATLRAGLRGQRERLCRQGEFFSDGQGTQRVVDVVRMMLGSR